MPDMQIAFSGFLTRPEVLIYIQPESFQLLHASGVQRVVIQTPEQLGRHTVSLYVPVVRVDSGNAAACTASSVRGLGASSPGRAMV